MIGRPHLARPSMLLVAALALGIATTAADPLPAVASPPVASDLHEDGPLQPRWLSTPSSRVVLNPLEVLDPGSPVDQSVDSRMTMDAGYYVDDRADRLDELVLVNERPPGSGPGLQTGSSAFREDFGSLSAWTPSIHTVASVASGHAVIRTPNTTGIHYGYITREVTVNLDTHPNLRISVPAVSGMWGLKVNDYTYPSDLVLQNNTAIPGVYLYDLPAETGWSGTKTFYIRIFAVGYNAPITVDEVSIRADAVPAVGVDDPFNVIDPAWSSSPTLVATASAGRATLSVPANASVHYGYLSRNVTVDLDRYGVLRISVPEVGGDWGLKVNAGGADVIIQNTTDMAGEFFFDIAAGTGWTSVKNFTIRIFAVGRGTDLVVDRISVMDEPDTWLGEAASVESSWDPHVVTTTGSYASGMSVTTRDAFHTPNSVVRLIEASSITTGRPVQLSGFYRGTPVWDGTSRTLTVGADGFSYSIAFPALTGSVTFYQNRDALRLGGPAESSPTSPSGYWAVVLDSGGAPTLSTSVGIGFRVAADGGPSSAALAQAAALPSLRATLVADRAAFWTAWLADVPHPENFAISDVPALGVTAAEVRKLYYRAWVFLFASVLPPQPETGFAHPSLATGKPALYRHGPAGASASASWDSMIGTQYLAYVEPDLAWDIYEGYMGLVPSTGHLGGEYLPAREAQTAWVLFQVTGDEDRLADSYDAMRRLLVYKQDHPKYGGDAVPDNKDIHFLSSALRDDTFAEQIAQVLGKVADVTFWQNRYATGHSQMLGWFWDPGDGQPDQKYNPVTGAREDGRVITTTAALVLPTIPTTQTSALVERFEELYDPSAPFAGFGQGTNDVRHPIMSYTIYGLLEHGELDYAETLSNALIRDAVRSGMLSERYQWDSSGPYPAGQRPSLFGAAQIIDNVWLKNGYRMDAGVPSFVMLSATSGGIEGLTLSGMQLEVTAEAASQAVSLSGSLVVQTSTCQEHTVPPGSTVRLAAACRTEL